MKPRRFFRVELDAQLPQDIMQKAGLARNQMIHVYNASRGGMSAESYVVPNQAGDDRVIMSGALSKVAGVGDNITIVSYALAREASEPWMVDVGLME